MLQNVMLAQALYLKYNNLQQKVARGQIDKNACDIGQDFSAITLQISNLFGEAFKISQKGKYSHILN